MKQSSQESGGKLFVTSEGNQGKDTENTFLWSKIFTNAKASHEASSCYCLNKNDQASPNPQSSINMFQVSIPYPHITIRLLCWHSNCSEMGK